PKNQSANAPCRSACATPRERFVAIKMDRATTSYETLHHSISTRQNCLLLLPMQTGESRTTPPTRQEQSRVSLQLKSNAHLPDQQKLQVCPSAPIIRSQPCRLP